MAIYAYYVQPHEVALYANKLSQKTYHTDVPTLWREMDVLRDRVKRRDQEIAALKSNNSRLERIVAQIRRIL